MAAACWFIPWPSTISLTNIACLCTRLCSAVARSCFLRGCALICACSNPGHCHQALCSCAMHAHDGPTKRKSPGRPTWSASITGRTIREMNDYNRRLIEEFRAHGSKVGGMWEGTPLLLLTTRGAKSGERRTTPMGYMPEGDRLIVFASSGGAPTHPDWYHNLVAHPQVTVEVGTETFNAIAVVAEDEERDRLWTKGVALYPDLAEHQAKTTRQFPVIALSR